MYLSQSKLVKRKDGRYKVNYGKKQFYGKTRAEALRKRDAYIAEQNKGLCTDFSQMTFEEYGLKWVEVYHGSCVAPSRRQYQGIVRFVAETLKPKLIRNITAMDLQEVANKMSVYSASYVNKFMSVLRGIFRTAVAEGAILRNPMDLVRRPKCKKCRGHRALLPWERELITGTCKEHDFGLCAMVMLYAGLRRGEAMYVDVDRDCDFVNHTLTVRGALSFTDGNTPGVSEGKTDNAQRTVPMVHKLEEALRGHHGLLCPKSDGGLMTLSAFERKYESYIAFLEKCVNGCSKRWYGKTREQKALIESGGALPEWKSISIRCHDFRVDFCTRAYYAGIPLKTLQKWMGHADETMILRVYTKLQKQEEDADIIKLDTYMEAV